MAFTDLTSPYHWAIKKGIDITLGVPPTPTPPSDAYPRSSVFQRDPLLTRCNQLVARADAFLATPERGIASQTRPVKQTTFQACQDTPPPTQTRFSSSLRSWPSDEASPGESDHIFGDDEGEVLRTGPLPDKPRPESAGPEPAVLLHAATSKRPLTDQDLLSPAAKKSRSALYIRSDAPAWLSTIVEEFEASLISSPSTRPPTLSSSQNTA